MQSDNVKKPNIKPNKKSKMHYSLLTVVLVICIVELAFGAFQNINKNVNFLSKINGLENLRNKELSKNKQLKSEIENFNSEISLESIARNNLKMAGENEVLIIINRPKTDSEAFVNVSNKKKAKHNKTVY